jgi:hypothetical protein
MTSQVSPAAAESLFLLSSCLFLQYSGPRAPHQHEEEEALRTRQAVPPRHDKHLSAAEYLFLSYSFNTQVRVRPTSMKKKKPSALDKQYRHVALLQRHNRRQAAQEAQQQQEQQRQQQELAEFSQQLRSSILAGQGSGLWDRTVRICFGCVFGHQQGQQQEIA